MIKLEEMKITLVVFSILEWFEVSRFKKKPDRLEGEKKGISRERDRYRFIDL